MRWVGRWAAIQAAALTLLALSWLEVAAEPYRVLVVMSYERDNPWVMEIREGIDAVLGNQAEITYFYMDTKANPAGGPAMAEEAHRLYRQLAPNGVITADDNAQSMFVVPYLKDTETTPVMFCCVNADASKYGYPSSNVSGTLERAHVRETLAFVQQLSPTVRTVSFVVKDSPSGKALHRQVLAEADSYSVKVEGFHLVKTSSEVAALGRDLRGRSDAIFIESLEGIVSTEGAPLNNSAVYEILYNAFQGPIVGANSYHVDQGALAAVVKTGQEQGQTAAEMLLKALSGTSVSAIPVTRNYRGRRIINVTTMEELELSPKPIDLRGATLVRTKP